MRHGAAVLAWKSHIYAWRGHLHEGRWKLRRLLAARSALLLVIFGGLGGIGGGFLIGHWAAGLVIIIESAGLVVLGLNQDDGADTPVLGRRTVEQVLDDERYIP